jgi:MFS family permease
MTPLQVLRRPDFLRLWACGVVLGTMRWLEVLVVGLYTLEHSGSALLVALMLFARTVPMVALGAVMGALADRIERRRLLAAGMLLVGLTAGVLSALSLAGALSLWHVAAGAFVNGIVWTMEHPVRRALIGDAVSADAMGAAISLDSATFNGTRMLGPLAGGALYASLGLSGAYAAGVVAYALAFVLVWGVSPPPARRAGAAGEREGFVRSVGAGLRYVASQRVLAAVMVVTVIANLFGFSYVAMVPVVGVGTLGLDAPGIGLLMSMEGAGATLGALTLAFVVRPAAYARVFSAGALLFLAMVLCFSRADSALPAMAALFVAGLGLAGFGAMQSTVLLSASAVAMRSRVMGVLVVCIGAGPLGVLLVGWLAERMGATAALALTAGAGLGLMVALCAWRPQLLRRYAPQSVP